MKIVELLQTRSRRFVAVVATILILLIGAAVYVTGAELSFSVFYLIPIAMVTWYVSTRAGMVASAASAIVWMLAEVAANRAYSSSAILFWNAAVRMSFFLIVTFALASLRASRLRQDELAHFVVHDLRSPLSNILASLQLMQSDADGSLRPDQITLIDISLASGNRMLTLINSLLDLARLESGRMKLALKPVEVRMLVDQTIQQVSALALRGATQVAYSVDEGAEMVLAEPDITVRVLVNLVSNALKYSPQDSIVSVRVQRTAGQNVTICVTDNGPGIPPEWIARVFDKFAQVEARKSGVAVGSGLGLTFCRLAVEAQGGRIWLESEVGKGTTVSFTLPHAGSGA